MPRAGVDHRLDGEAHALFQRHAGAGTAVVQNLRILVIDLTDAVAAILSDHREALAFGIGLDCMTDVAQRGARLHGADAAPHRLAGHLDQALGQHRRLAGEEHAAVIAVPAVLDDGDIDIDDVAVLEDLARARDAVADDVVDRRAAGSRKALVADVGRDRLQLVDDEVVAAAIQLFGGHARLDVFTDHVQHLGDHAAGNAHLLDLFGGLDGYAHPPIIAACAANCQPPIIRGLCRAFSPFSRPRRTSPVNTHPRRQPVSGCLIRFGMRSKRQPRGGPTPSHEPPLPFRRRAHV